MIKQTTLSPILDPDNCYLVGGAVRDELLGLKVNEKDWVVTASSPEEMLDLGFVPVGKDFPVFLHPQTKEEYALARTERKTAKGYHGFQFHTDSDVTLEDDLIRRDLTVNAIAKDANGKIIDPHGGVNDLKAKILRHVSPAFSEDPVRILRVARFASRFATLGFSIAPETMKLMQTMVANGEVSELVPERVFKEFSRALAEDSPQVFIQVLRDCGALKVVLPEIDVLFGIPNPVKWHPEVDTGIHTLMVLQQAAELTDDPMVRFAAVCHDLGKGITPKQYWPSHKGHEKAGIKIVKKLCERIKAPKDWRELAQLSSEFHLHGHRLLEMKASTIVTTLEKLDAFRRPERFAKFLITCEADARGRTDWEDKPYPQRQQFWDLYLAAESIDSKTIVAESAEPKDIKQNIHAARVTAVKQAIQNIEN